MANVKTAILAFTLSILLCAMARAELKWERTTLELHPAIEDKDAVGHFKYQNTGDKPVRFKSVRTSCGCTAAQTQKDEVPAGEKGEITATFHIGDRIGTQEKSVTVETDDPTQAVTILTIRAVIQQLLEIKPTFVYWQADEAPKAKTINVTAAKDSPVAQIKVASSSPEFQTKVERVRKGEFKIDIQPKMTSKPASARLTIQPENSPKIFYATASVTATAPKPIWTPPLMRNAVAPPPGTSPTPASPQP